MRAGLLPLFLPGSRAHRAIRFVLMLVVLGCVVLALAAGVAATETGATGQADVGYFGPFRW